MSSTERGPPRGENPRGPSDTWKFLTSIHVCVRPPYGGTGPGGDVRPRSARLCDSRLSDSCSRLWRSEGMRRR